MVMPVRARNIFFTKESERYPHWRTTVAIGKLLRSVDWKKRIISMRGSISYFQTLCPNEYVFYFQSGKWGPSDYVILMGKEIK